MIILRGPKADIVIPKNYTIEPVGLVTFTIINMAVGTALLVQMNDKAKARFPTVDFIVNTIISVYPMDVDDNSKYNCRVTGDGYKLVKS